MSSETHKRIEERAYQLWDEAGRPEGQAEHYWRTAEAEVAGEAHSGGGIPVTDEQEGPPATTEDAAPRPKRPRNAKPKT